MSRNFYIADCHFGHQSVLRFDSRPFCDLQEMEEKMISNWNKVVLKNDVVYVLGDFIWYKESLWPTILEQLKGQIVLIKGNHDLHQLSAKTKSYFADIKDYKEIVDEGRHIILCHYPIPFYRNDYQENFWMLYGHVHNTKENSELQILREQLLQNKGGVSNRAQFVNVGCMMPWMNYTPRTLNEIIESFKKEENDEKAG